jgi:hypothetical protein
MSKETSPDDPRQKTDGDPLKQADKPRKGPPEKEPSDHAGSRKVAGNPHTLTEAMMAVDKPIGDNARKGAVNKRTQLKSSAG